VIRLHRRDRHDCVTASKSRFSAFVLSPPFALSAARATVMSRARVAGALTCGAVLLSLGLSACSASAVNATTAASAVGPISIWYSNNAQEVTWGEQVVASWNASHPDQTVSGQQIPASQSSEEVIGAAITAGSEPCLIYNTAPAAVPSFEQERGLVPLNDFPDGAAYIQARTGASASAYKSADGKYYQLPWKSNPVMIFYNKTEFAKAGISTTNPPLSTYADFLTTSKKLVSSGAAKYAIYPAPTSEFYQSWYDFYPLYAAETGGTELVANGKSTFNDAAGNAVAAFWQQLYAQNLAGKETYNGDSFADGTAAMAIVGPWAVANYKGKVNWGVVPLPTSKGNTSDQIPTFSDAKNIAMYASCKNRATAWAFLKYSTSVAEDSKLLSMTGQMPMRQGMETLYAPYFKANPAYTEFGAEAAHVVEVPNVPNSIEVWQVFRDDWSKSVIFGKESSAAGLASAAKAINKLVSTSPSGADVG
jgi:multiple sugar transport system substrate-binding protein